MSLLRAHRRVLGWAVGLGAVVAVAGCGSSASSGTGGTGTSASSGSLAAFEAQANAICASASATERRLPKPKGPADVKRFLDADFPSLQHATKQLRALTPPPAEAAAYQRYVSAVSQQLADLAQAKADADRGDVTAAINLANSTGRDIQTRAHQTAVAAHLAQCAR